MQLTTTIKPMIHKNHTSPMKMMNIARDNNFMYVGGRTTVLSIESQASVLCRVYYLF